MDTAGSNQHAVILFASLVDDREAGSWGDALALELSEEFQQVLRDILLMFRGNEVEATSAGVLVEFPHALAATECALEIQRTLAQRNERKSTERQIQTRIGIQLGRVIRGGDRADNLSAMVKQIAASAAPGGICMDRGIFEQVRLPQPCVALTESERVNLPAEMEVYKLMPGLIPEVLAAADASRKQLQWLVLGIVALNIILFWVFGLSHKSSPQPGSASTNPPAVSGITNHP
jgi:adenylate cyclase